MNHHHPMLDPWNTILTHFNPHYPSNLSPLNQSMNPNEMMISYSDVSSYSSKDLPPSKPMQQYPHRLP
ncbi:unnamed protein product [Rotaria sp. Silwood2]|nr:unnamed protein product [Rotaria sp. Silwood2]CAF3026009.1 unnamed protein product [Rotaria sp. Silwood2]CAF4065097.1 unnamed protein product [Rotaria sp. Silwood2]CAF4337690.1 unnamed protein product [Rotaria sp. Silwood2]